MVKTKKYFILVTAVLSFYLCGCATLQEVLNTQRPHANLKNVALQDFTMKSATLLFDVEVDNPYPVDLPLLNMDYNVASGTDKLFAGKADLQTSIPAKNKKVVSLPATINYMDLVRAFKGIRPGTKIPYKADLGLSTNAPALGTITLPLSKVGELSVPSLPKVDETDLKKMLLDKLGKQ